MFVPFSPILTRIYLFVADVEVLIAFNHIHTHSVAFLWTSNRSVAETSDNTQHSYDTEFHAPSGIRTRHPSKRVAPDPHLYIARPPGSPI